MESLAFTPQTSRHPLGWGFNVSMVALARRPTSIRASRQVAKSKAYEGDSLTPIKPLTCMLDADNSVDHSLQSLRAVWCTRCPPCVANHLTLEGMPRAKQGSSETPEGRVCARRP